MKQLPSKDDLKGYVSGALDGLEEDLFWMLYFKEGNPDEIKALMGAIEEERNRRESEYKRHERWKRDLCRRIGRDNGFVNDAYEDDAGLYWSDQW